MAALLPVAGTSQMRTCLRPGAAGAPQRHAVARRVRVNAMTGEGDIRASKFEQAMFGENFGARDPFAGEIESNFGEKVLGNYNTEHIIKPPDAIKGLIGLTARSCRDNVESLALLDSADTERLRQQVPGWRVVTSSSAAPLIQHEWTLKDEASAQQLAASIQQIADMEGHPVTLREVGTMLIAEITTPSLGGLTENDFMVAAKVNELDVKDLLKPRKARFWA